MRKTIPQSVYDLQTLFRRIQALMEWRNLEMEQARKGSLFLVLDTSTGQDIETEIGRFWLLCPQVESDIAGLDGRRRALLRNWVTKLRTAILWQADRR